MDEQSSGYLIRDEFTDQVIIMADLCPICSRQVKEQEGVRCSVCGILMHKSCASDEALMDADGNILCPYDTLLAALDWFDAVISTYPSALNEEQRSDIVGRLKSYIDIISGRGQTS